MKRQRRIARRRGSAMIELTLSIVFLVPLFVGLWEFGYAFHLYSELENAVRAGARYASVRTYDSPTTTPSSAFLTAVQNMTVYGDPTGGTTPVVPGLTTDNVQLAVTFTSGMPTSMTVSINNFYIPSYVGKIPLRGKPYVWFPYAGTFGPP